MTVASWKPIAGILTANGLVRREGGQYYIVDLPRLLAAETGGKVTAKALIATGWGWDFAPVQDLSRDNRWGRTYETWAEQPMLAAALGAANVHGLQAAGSGDSWSPSAAMYVCGVSLRFFAHSISVARSPAGRNLYGAGSRLPICRSSSAFVERIRPGSPAKRRSSASAAEWNVDARTPSTPSAANLARSSPAALSVKVHATSSCAANAPLATCHAIRRVIVVVLPVPAPARMHTGPRVASTAARCSEFSPAKIRSASKDGPP